MKLIPKEVQEYISFVVWKSWNENEYTGGLWFKLEDELPVCDPFVASPYLQYDICQSPQGTQYIPFGRLVLSCPQRLLLGHSHEEEEEEEEIENRVINIDLKTLYPELVSELKYTQNPKIIKRKLLNARKKPEYTVTTKICTCSTVAVCTLRNIFVAIDSLDNLFCFDLDNNKYWWVMDCSDAVCVYFHPHCDITIFVGRSNGRIDKLSLVKRKVLDCFKEHTFAVKSMSFSNDLCLSQSKYEAWIWHVNSLAPLFSLVLKKDIPRILTTFIPKQENSILTLIPNNNTFYIWSDGEHNFPQLKAMYSGLEFKMSKETELLEVSRDNPLMALAGNHNEIHILNISSLLEWNIQRLLFLPTERSHTIAMKFIKIPDYNGQLDKDCLAVLSSCREIIIYDLYETNQNAIAEVIDIEGVPIDFHLTSDYKYAIFQTSRGFLEVYTTFWWLNEDFCPWLHFKRQTRSLLLYKNLKHFFDSNLELDNNMNTSSVNVEKIRKSDEAFIKKHMFKSMLLNKRKIESKNRCSLWMKAFELPNNSDAFLELYRFGIHPFCAELTIKYKFLANKLVKFVRLMSVFYNWSPIFIVIKGFEEVVLRFCEVFNYRIISAFEFIITFMENYCSQWHSNFPDTPQKINVIINNLIQDDRELTAHFKKHNIKGSDITWMILHSLFTKILKPLQWEMLLDYVIAEDDKFLVMLAVSFMMNSRNVFLGLKTTGELRNFEKHLYAHAISDLKLGQILSTAYNLSYNRVQNDWPFPNFKFRPILKSLIYRDLSIYFDKELLGLIVYKMKLNREIDLISLETKIDNLKLLDPRIFHPIEQGPLKLYSLHPDHPKLAKAIDEHEKWKGESTIQFNQIVEKMKRTGELKSKNGLNENYSSDSDEFFNENKKSNQRYNLKITKNKSDSIFKLMNLLNDHELCWIKCYSLRREEIKRLEAYNIYCENFKQHETELREQTVNYFKRKLSRVLHHRRFDHNSIFKMSRLKNTKYEKYLFFRDFLAQCMKECGYPLKTILRKISLKTEVSEQVLALNLGLWNSEDLDPQRKHTRTFSKIKEIIMRAEEATKCEEKNSGFQDLHKGIKKRAVNNDQQMKSQEKTKVESKGRYLEKLKSLRNDDRTMRKYNENKSLGEKVKTVHRRRFEELVHGKHSEQNLIIMRNLSNIAEGSLQKRFPTPVISSSENEDHQKIKPSSSFLSFLKKIEELSMSKTHKNIYKVPWRPPGISTKTKEIYIKNNSIRRLPLRENSSKKNLPKDNEDLYKGLFFFYEEYWPKYSTDIKKGYPSVSLDNKVNIRNTPLHNEYSNEILDSSSTNAVPYTASPCLQKYRNCITSERRKKLDEEEKFKVLHEVPTEESSQPNILRLLNNRGKIQEDYSLKRHILKANVCVMAHPEEIDKSHKLQYIEPYYVELLKASNRDIYGRLLPPESHQGKWPYKSVVTPERVIKEEPGSKAIQVDLSLVTEKSSTRTSIHSGKIQTQSRRKHKENRNCKGENIKYHEIPRLIDKQENNESSKKHAKNNLLLLKPSQERIHKRQMYPQERLDGRSQLLLYKLSVPGSFLSSTSSLNPQQSLIRGPSFYVGPITVRENETLFREDLMRSGFPNSEILISVLKSPRNIKIFRMILKKNGFSIEQLLRRSFRQPKNLDWFKESLIKIGFPTEDISIQELTNLKKIRKRITISQRNQNSRNSRRLKFVKMDNWLEKSSPASIHMFYRHRKCSMYSIPRVSSPQKDGKCTRKYEKTESAKKKGRKGVNSTSFGSYKWRQHVNNLFLKLECGLYHQRILNCLKEFEDKAVLEKTYADVLKLKKMRDIARIKRVMKRMKKIHKKGRKIKRRVKKNWNYMNSILENHTYTNQGSSVYLTEKCLFSDTNANNNDYIRNDCEYKNKDLHDSELDEHGDPNDDFNYVFDEEDDNSTKKKENILSNRMKKRKADWLKCFSSLDEKQIESITEHLASLRIKNELLY